MTEFEEYLRGTFEINNGVENDVDNLVRIHAPELLKLAKKELMKDDKFLIAIGDAYVDWIDGGINTNDEDSADYIRKNMIYERQ